MDLRKKIARSITGYECDLIAREEKAGHEYTDEYGVGETAVHNFNTCLNHDNVVVMPVTSTSSEYVNKRRKVDS
ncbi:hypothetical protein INT47_000375 [Mucor saturninus]|uniref:Uncharacterized protein n=1 Tax=Mucor saturninus TaxID=64648 RepID=A0A8H7V1L3_9FUNG|nr:hypothetical protein INT47_000375 [Mucor saturninus]